MLPVTQALLLANLGVFLLQYLIVNDRVLLWFALWPFGSAAGYSFQPWQLVTYSLLHGNLAHLFFNMLPLVMFGSDIERLFGGRGFLVFYVVCVISAALTHLIVSPLMGLPGLPTVGASGGIFGLLLAFGVFFPRRKLMLLFPPIPIEARVFVILYGALELFLGITNTAQGVAHFAHLGGMLGAWLYILYRPRSGRR